MTAVIETGLLSVGIIRPKPYATRGMRHTLFLEYLFAVWTIVDLIFV